MDTQIKGLAQGLIAEIIKADMSMHEAQLEAWTWMSKNRPTGEDIPKNIMEGMPRHRYLSMKEVELEMSIKPIKTTHFFQRLWFGLKFIFNGSYQHPLKDRSFKICSPNDLKAQKIKICVKRLENGNIKAEYKASDSATQELLKKG